ncbi:hypothetical protein [Aquimarina litoralis]|uniref:hypothetical protein n=1 Tax=Aquimarina litoralis TaxID=584605 RepID=UPI001C5614A6|nr:hypothetical protein [Aquimarina litoralis]MBW1295204.1 hypothetical protein [Aquimarina litoralis]
MKYLLLFLLICIGCTNTTNTNKESKVEEKPDPPKIEKNNSTKKSDDSFDMVFMAKEENTNDDFSQKLRINWFSLYEIQYNIIYSNQLCEGECSGNAVRKDFKITTKTNTYPEGDYEFSFIEFEDQKEDFSILIRIQASDKKEAEVEFVYKNEPGDCSPYEALMLKVK